MFKRIVCLLTVVCLLSICLSCFATAETSWSAVFKAEQTSSQNDENIVTVRVAVSSITSETGIICASYNLYYDTKCLELVSWKNNTPAGWDFSESATLCAEDWSQIVKEDGTTYFMYTLMNVATDNGVKDDNVLYTDLQFKVLDKNAASTNIKVTDIVLVDANDLNKGTTLDLADKTLALELNGNGEVDSSTDVSEESSADESSEEEVSNTVSTPEGENPGNNLVTVDITLNGIKDPAGVASLLFHVKYDSKKLSFVRYESLMPDSWRNDTVNTENLTPAEQVNGDLYFWVLNADEASGVTEDGALGFRVVFEVLDGTFETSWLTIEAPEVINTLLQEVSTGDYTLSITEAIEEGTNDSIAPNEGDDQGSKIVIAVAAAVLVLGSAVVIWIIARKKKNK